MCFQFLCSINRRHRLFQTGNGFLQPASQEGDRGSKALNVFMAFDMFCSNALQKSHPPINIATHEDEPLVFSEVQLALETDVLSLCFKCFHRKKREGTFEEHNFISAAHQSP